MKKLLFLFLFLPFLNFGQVLAQGDYIISSANTQDIYPNFKTITSAINYLNLNGIKGNVRLLLNDPQYDLSKGEVFPITIKQFAGSIDFNVTIKPNSGKVVSVNASTKDYNNPTAVFKLDGADNITFDGSNLTNGKSKDLTLYNTNPNPGNGVPRSVIWIASKDNNDGANNNIIKNIILKHDSKGTSTIAIGIFAGGTENITSTAKAANSHTTVTNVEFSKVGEAIFVNGNSNSNSLSSNWVISDNVLGNTSEDNSLKPYVAVHFVNVKDYTISNNVMDGLVRDQSQVITSKHAAVWIDGNSNGQIFNNKIANIRNTLGDSYVSSRGIYINASNNFIYNNFISDVSSAVNTGGTISSGIYVESGTNNKIYYNTIVQNSRKNIAEVSSCLHINNGSQIDIRNNIFYNSGSGVNKYAIYAAVLKTAFTSIDKNDYYAPIIGFLASARTTLKDWQDATGKDAQSINVIPKFVTADLHLEDIPENSALKAGTPIITDPSITTDIDGQARNSVKPYIGADEIVCLLPATAGVISGPTNVCAGTTIDYSVPTILNATSYSWSYSGTGVTFTNGTTNNPTITFAANATSGILTVRGKNNCGDGIVATLGVVVNPSPKPTFTTTPQNQTCGDLHIWYETQAGKYDYFWEVSGTKDVDYKLIDKGTNYSHQIVIEWLTAGPKTVKVNYSDTVGGCKGLIPAIYSTQVLITDQGRVKGGGDFCAGTPLPLLTLYRFNGNDVPYSDASVVLKWQYSDDVNNENWIDIPETKGKVTYTPTAFPGKFRTYRAFLQNGSCSKTAIETRISIITVSPPAVRRVTQPTCLSSISSVVLNELPVSGTIIQTGTVSAKYSIIGGGTQVIDKLIPGTYHFAVNNGSCTSGMSVDVVINPVNNTWNGSTWSNAGKLPTLDQAIIFAGDFNSTGDIEGCSCTVNTGKKVVFKSVDENSGHTLKIADKIEVLGTGILIMQKNTNLMQLNAAAVNSGNIEVQKIFNFITPAEPKNNRQQYNYISSPVIGGNLKNIYPGNPAALYHNESTNTFAASSGANITGRALAVQEPSTGAVPTNMVTAIFTGVPFNGVLEYTLANTTTKADVSHGFNLVGNPYPSNLDLELLYSYANGSDSNADKIETTFQFWDNRGNTEFRQKGSSYNGDSYAKYNVFSATGLPAASSKNNKENLKLPTQFVSIGTGFMVRAKVGANGKKLVFNNNMRSKENTYSYTGKQSDRDRFYISLRTPTDLEIMSAVVYFEGGNNNIGPEDTEASSSSDGIYSIVEGAKLAIQGRSLFTYHDTVPLGVSFFTAGSYTISLPIKNGVFAGSQNVYLKDKQTRIITNLSQGAYTFNAEKGDVVNRFEIIYQPDAVLVTDNKVKDGLVVYKDTNSFVIASSSDKIIDVEVYDAVGRLVYKIKPNSKTAQIASDHLSSGVYILKISQGNQITSKKVIK